MENTAQALHNAVRRYCYDHFRHWCDVYAAMGKDNSAGSYRYNEKQLDTFPRYNVLNAIRVSVEQIDSEQLVDFEETKRLLDSVGETANDVMTRAPSHAIASAAQDDEREKYSAFVRSLTEESVWNYDRLPYQRVLTDDETTAIRQELSSHWKILTGGNWYPLIRTDVTDIVGFDADAFDKSIPNHAVARMITSLTTSRIYELREYGPCYVQDVDAISPIYNGAEGFWTSDEFDWVLYASHHATITVAGTLLVCVKASWPSWSKHEIKPM